MAYEMRDNSGTLFKTKEKKNENSPDYYGDCMIDGVKHKISGWIKHPTNGGPPFISFSFRPADDQGGRQQSSGSNQQRGSNQRQQDQQRDTFF
jgi:hypothetical protein